MAAKDRAPCPKCGRPNAPIRYNGAFHCHTRQGTDARRYEYCYGPRDYNYYMGGLGFAPFDNAILYGKDRLREQEKEEMGTIEYYDKRIEMLKNKNDEEVERLKLMRDRAIEKEIERDMARARFGSNDDYEDGAIIFFTYRYGGYGIAYSFVALKAGKMGGWYTTNKNDKNWYTWEELIDKYLTKAIEVYYVTAMEKL